VNIVIIQLVNCKW